MHELIERWSGESVVTAYDRPTGTWIFIAIHDTTLGPAMGGCRMKVYDTPDEALLDAMRLAEGMTSKWASIGFDLGGGKSVLAVPRPLDGEERRGLLLRFGRILESLRGAYSTGEDLGTTPEDMATLAEATQHVHGTRGDGGPATDPGPFTALGVFVGIRSGLRRVFGEGDPTGRTVLIQGAGDVGVPLGRMLAEAGARVVVADLDRGRAEELARALGGGVVDAEEVYQTACDVYAPCAVGATLNRESIPRLACRIVAGSANNQLGEEADADRLHQRGILYAPDYVINAGGATALPMLGQGEPRVAVEERIRGLEGVLDEIFAEASEHQESPLYAAKRRVERVLAAAR